MRLSDVWWFWSSVDLTGNQTTIIVDIGVVAFWSSVDLTGNQTLLLLGEGVKEFWSSVDLTGNQTLYRNTQAAGCFGAVSI